MPVGVDLGGTKIEAVAMDAAGAEIFRQRMPTPRHDYSATIAAIAQLTAQAQATGLLLSCSIRPRRCLRCRS